MSQTASVEAIYPLSPLQQGILFHSLYAPDSGLYFEHFTCDLSGALDVPAFRRAWERVLARHAILRTLFVWERQEKMLQVVRPHVDLPWQELDWRADPAATQQTRWEEFLAADRRQGFDLGRAPLLRLTLVRTADTEYRLVWSHHHLLLDGWSLFIVLNDLFAFYDAFRAGHDLALPQPRPYRDYITWLGQQDLAQAEQFWRKHLAEFTTPTPLPHWQPASQPSAPARFAEEHTQVPHAVSSALHALARTGHVTLNTVIQSAWALLLSRYSGKNDVLFGATVAGRPHDLNGVEHMVGMFINTLPVRIQLAPHLPLSQWLMAVQADLAELRQYEYSPLVQIQGWSAVPRGQTLFESLLVFENYPVSAPAIASPVVSGTTPDAPADSAATHVRLTDMNAVERTNYPLTLAVGPGEQITFKIIYDTTRFTQTDILRLWGHWETVLADMAAHPDQPLAAIAWLDPAERQQILVEWNATQAPYPAEAALATLFETQVARTPDAPALEFEGTTISYATLNARANQLAHHLLTLIGHPPVNQPIALCLERAPDMVLGMLAILKAGGAYVPLDAGYPPERLAFMLRDSGAAVLITQSTLAARFAPHGGQQILLDAEADTLAQAHTANPSAPTSGDHLAYIMYTSGSTGQPKGIAIPQCAVSRLVFNTNYIALGPDERMAQFSNMSFDAATFEIWGALLHGGTLVSVPRDHALAPHKMAQFLSAQRITTLFLTTALFNQIARETPRAFAPLRTVLFGGEAVDPRLVRDILTQGAPQRLLHVYGPTECTTFALWHLVTAVAETATTVPIGRPLTNTLAYVLDASGRPVSLGVAGELFVGGPGLAHGYWNRPALSAERFVPDPFTRDPGARLYRTGDLVRYNAEGALEFLGRTDEQVKLRGFRIEPGEIASVLLQHPAVESASVLLREDAPGDKQLVAYWVPRAGAQADAHTLREFIHARLPAYMVPAAFVTMHALPLTPNGKVDRRALPAPDLTHLATSAAYVAPRTPVEEVLVGIWARVLRRERVGVDDDFFELGGHSLSATQLLTRIREAFKIDLPLRTIFEATTVAKLAQTLVSHEREPGQLDKVARAVKRLEGMSPEQIKQALQAERTRRGTSS